MISRIVIKVLYESECAFIRKKIIADNQRQNIINNLKELKESILVTKEC